MKSKNKLEPSVLITVDTDGIYRIPIIVSNSIGKILYMTSVYKSVNYYSTRKNILEVIDNLIIKYNVDMILLEQNKIFIDKIDKFPDPYVLRNVVLGFGIQVSLEDKYFDKILILALPEYEWKNNVLGYKKIYAIDLYKAHVLHRTDIPKDFLVAIENNNYYKAICLSESVLFYRLMDKKYLLNKHEGEEK